MDSCYGLATSPQRASCTTRPADAKRVFRRLCTPRARPASPRTGAGPDCRSGSTAFRSAAWGPPACPDGLMHSTWTHCAGIAAMAGIRLSPRGTDHERLAHRGKEKNTKLKSKREATIARGTSGFAGVWLWRQGHLLRMERLGGILQMTASTCWWSRPLFRTGGARESSPERLRALLVTKPGRPNPSHNCQRSLPSSSSSSSLFFPSPPPLLLSSPSTSSSSVGLALTLSFRWLPRLHVGSLDSTVHTDLQPSRTSTSRHHITLLAIHTVSDKSVLQSWVFSSYPSGFSSYPSGPLMRQERLLSVGTDGGGYIIYYVPIKMISLSPAPVDPAAFNRPRQMCTIRQTHVHDRALVLVMRMPQQEEQHADASTARLAGMLLGAQLRHVLAQEA